LNPGVLRQAPGVFHVLAEATQFFFHSIGHMGTGQSIGIIEQHQQVS
jgi:hypothetical protein